MKKYKFSGHKYITAGVNAELPSELVRYIWKMVESKKNEKDFEMDYLQVFTMKPIAVDGEKMQEITHMQEQPIEYEKTYHISTNTIITEKVYVIDDVSHVTMLLAREY